MTGRTSRWAGGDRLSAAPAGTFACRFGRVLRRAWGPGAAVSRAVSLPAITHSDCSILPSERHEADPRRRRRDRRRRAGGGAVHDQCTPPATRARRSRRCTRWRRPAASSCACRCPRRPTPTRSPRSSRTLRCRSSPTSTSTGAWRWRRSSAAPPACASTPARWQRHARARDRARRPPQPGAAIRIGVNSGSLPRDLRGLAASEPDRRARRGRAALRGAVRGVGLHRLQAHREELERARHDRRLPGAARRSAAPLHVGVTEAGTVWRGTIKSAVGIGALLADGIGDTIRVSLTGDPVEEVRVAWEILAALGLRRRGPDLISCPTCGRTEVDLVALAEEVEERLRAYPAPISVAVMGCRVNGPEEARHADFGIAAGRGEGVLFDHGEVATLPEDRARRRALRAHRRRARRHGGRAVSRRRTHRSRRRAGVVMLSGSFACASIGGVPGRRLPVERRIGVGRWHVVLAVRTGAPAGTRPAWSWARPSAGGSSSPASSQAACAS